MRRMRRLHRWAGLAGAGFLALSVVTGLLWAYAPHLYWKDDYKKKKAPLPSPALTDVRVGAGEALAGARRRLGGIAFSSLTLRPDFGRLVYEARGEEASRERAVLLDAVTGEVLSPLSEPLAVVIARQYVPPGFTLEGAVPMETYKGRDGKERGSAMLVRFREGGGTEIVVDRSSGQVLEESDRARRFHFWVIRLHRLEFFGFKKTLTAVPGAFLIFLLLSGLRVELRRKGG